MGGQCDHGWTHAVDCDVCSPPRAKVGQLEARIAELEAQAFSFADRILFRQWFESMQDTNPKYITDADRELFERVKRFLEKK